MKRGVYRRSGETIRVHGDPDDRGLVLIEFSDGTFKWVSKQALDILPNQR